MVKVIIKFPYEILGLFYRKITVVNTIVIVIIYTTAVYKTLNGIYLTVHETSDVVV